MCKKRGNFYSLFDNPCTTRTQDIAYLHDESYATQLMKAITAAFYGIRHMADGNVDLKLLGVDFRYERLLEVVIPTTLEGLAKSHHPFTLKGSGDTYGNGAVGYTIYHIKRENNIDYFELVMKTGFKKGGALGKFETSLAFFKNSEFVPHINSTLFRCNKVYAKSGTESSPLTMLSISLIVAVSLLAVFLVSMTLVIFFCRNSKYSLILHL